MANGPKRAVGVQILQSLHARRQLLGTIPLWPRVGELGAEWRHGDMVQKVVLIGLAALAGQRKGTALNPSADGTFAQPPHPDL